MNRCGILSRGDVFVSGRSYDDLLRVVIHKLVGQGVPAAMKWLVKYGGDNFESCDLCIRDGEASSEDGEAHTVYFVTTLDPDLKENGYRIGYTVFRLCTEDADDPGFVGDWVVRGHIPIRAYCRKGSKSVMKWTSMNLIFKDAMSFISEIIETIDYAAIKVGCIS